jgi:hypothetical protein
LGREIFDVAPPLLVAANATARARAASVAGPSGCFDKIAAFNVDSAAGFL